VYLISKAAKKRSAIPDIISLQFFCTNSEQALGDDEKNRVAICLCQAFLAAVRLLSFRRSWAKVVCVRTTNLNFCPFLLICFQIGSADFFTTIVNYKIS